MPDLTVVDQLVEAVADGRRLHVVCAGVVYEGSVAGVLRGTVTLVGRILGLAEPIREIPLPLADVTDVAQPVAVPVSLATRMVRARNLRVDP
jgi:hypothetical protein